MKQVDICSIRELLLTTAINHNKTKLAKFLNVSRGTLAKYEKDTQMNHHCIYMCNGKWVLRVTPISNDKAASL